MIPIAVLPNTHGSTVLVFWDDFHEERAILGWAVYAIDPIRPHPAHQPQRIEVEPITIETEGDTSAQCIIERGPEGVLSYTFVEDRGFTDREEAIAYGRAEAQRMRAAMDAVRAKRQGT